jgi:hypothetical protein
MVPSVLNYAKPWLFMVSDEWMDSAIRNFDREIFYGPYGRWADGVSWTLPSPTSVTDRCDPSTDIIVQEYDGVNGVNVKHGSSWDGFLGNSSGRVAQQLNMSWDEYVASVTTTYGFKPGRLLFISNQNRELRNRNARHAVSDRNVALIGYELTNIVTI